MAPEEDLNLQNDKPQLIKVFSFLFLKFSLKDNCLI